MRFYNCVIFPNINSLMHECTFCLSFNNVVRVYNKIHPIRGDTLKYTHAEIRYIVITVLPPFGKKKKMKRITQNYNVPTLIIIQNTMTMITRYESHFLFLIRSRANGSTVLRCKRVYAYVWVCVCYNRSFQSFFFLYLKTLQRRGSCE